MKLSAGEIDAIIVGCVGVTPGPWRAHIEQEGIEAPNLTAFVTGGDFVIANLPQGKSVSKYATNADHIARLDPATVLALAELALDGLSYRTVMAEIDALADKARKTETHGTDE